MLRELDIFEWAAIVGAIVTVAGVIVGIWFLLHGFSDPCAYGAISNPDAHTQVGTSLMGPTCR